MVVQQQQRPPLQVTTMVCDDYLIILVGNAKVRMYCICVASVLGLDKVNLELIFTTPPSIAQVMSRATVAFNRLARLRGYSTEFAVSFAMVFDDYEGLWVPLERSTQLTHNAQLYVFQPDVVDTPGHIPDPVSALQLLDDYASPARNLTPSYAAHHESPRAPPPTSFPPRNAQAVYPTPEDIRRESERRRRLIDMSDIPGDSILRVERENEARKLELPVDTHRETVRRETQTFLEAQWSPSRGSH